MPTGLADDQTAQVVWIGASAAGLGQKPDMDLKYNRIQEDSGWVPLEPLRLATLRGRFMGYRVTGLGPGLPDYQVTGLGPP